MRPQVWITVLILLFLLAVIALAFWHSGGKESLTELECIEKEECPEWDALISPHVRLIRI